MSQQKDRGAIHMNGRDAICYKCRRVARLSSRTMVSGWPERPELDRCKDGHGCRA